jgi:hypothetical protein
MNHYMLYVRPGVKMQELNKNVFGGDLFEQVGQLP